MGHFQGVPSAEQFLGAFSNALRAAESRADQYWSRRGGRTFVLKGDGERGGPPGDRAGSVLHKAFNDLGYRDGGHTTNERVFMHEWLSKDVVAVNGLGASWSHGCWRGRYRIDVVCELENELSEFALTVRGMLDIRAALRVGIFFAPTADPMVGEALWNRHCADPLTAMSSWASPPSGGPWTFAEGESVLLMVLSSEHPSLLWAQTHEFSSSGWTTREM